MLQKKIPVANLKVQISSDIYKLQPYETAVEILL